jgi:hypothetical protein
MWSGGTSPLRRRPESVAGRVTAIDNPLYRGSVDPFNRRAGTASVIIA